LANILETRINGTALLELTSKLPQVRNVQYINSITEEFMGIPQNLDSEKRKIAQYIIEQNKDIASIFFLTPTGDIYIGEPFSDQLHHLHFCLFCQKELNLSFFWWRYCELVSPLMLQYLHR
jgi:hypothetical protein